jgi:hypothetical protein
MDKKEPDAKFVSVEEYFVEGDRVDQMVELFDYSKDIHSFRFVDSRSLQPPSLSKQLLGFDLF